MLNTKKKMMDNFTVTQQLFERTSLLANERVTSQILTQDDFNYAQFNDKVFEMHLPVEASKISEQSEEDEDDEGEQTKEQRKSLSPHRTDYDDRIVKVFNQKQKYDFQRKQDADPFSEILFSKLISQKHKEQDNLFSIEEQILKLQRQLDVAN